MPRKARITLLNCSGLCCAFAETPAHTKAETIHAVQGIPKAFEILQAQNGRVGTLSNQFSELLVDAGLREPRNHKSRNIGRSGKRGGLELSFHSLRHTAVSLLKDAGVPDSVVQALVGHESAAMDDVIAVTAEVKLVWLVSIRKDRTSVVPGSKDRIASFIVFDGRRPASWIRMFSKACR